MDTRVERFLDALKTLERTGDTEPLAALYASDARIGNVLSPGGFEGPEGARHFWRTHRDSVGGLESTFRNILAAGDRAALEWVIEGTQRDGRSLRLEGVSVIEFRGDRIARFQAYFDPRALGHQVLAPEARPAGGEGRPAGTDFRPAGEAGSLMTESTREGVSYGTPR